MVLENKKILLGVCGSIAAYKAPELVRLFRGAGAQVRVMMTANAGHFVTPITLQTLSGHPVMQDMFDGGGGIVHLEAARDADVVVIAPATANMLAKMAWGLADDFVSTAVLACEKPVLVAPAMNERMWRNSLVKRNVKILKGAGYHFVGPESGELACGENGAGRQADLKKILWEAARLAFKPDLKGKNILITAGPTREYADPVRFLSNASSGKMGCALAREAYFRGAGVTVVAGPVAVEVPDGVRVFKAVSAEDILKNVMREIGKADVFVSSAAVSDYRFESVKKQKIRKSRVKMRADMVLSPDILALAGNLKKGPFIVGFALESENRLRNAVVKMGAKHADMMVVNGPEALESDQAEVLLMTGGKTEKFSKMSKENIARNIFNRVVKFI